MNFEAFQNLRRQRLLQGGRDCGETNLYRCMESFRPNPLAEPHGPNKTWYRCDLARLWLNYYGFPEAHSRHALVCRGIRHALRLLFQYFSASNIHVMIPEDVYPVYGFLAQSAGLKPSTFPTLPEIRLPNDLGHHPVQALLLCNPWKPLGSFLHPKDLTLILNWLQGHSNRWVLIDSVYDFTKNFHATTRNLLETGQTILLHSITKSWLWPETFGVAYCPNTNAPWTELFRNESPSQDQLRIATECLSQYQDTPFRLKQTLDALASDFLLSLPHPIQSALLTPQTTLAPGSYFFPVSVEAEDLWNEHRIIALPASVFGSVWTGSLLSSLTNHVHLARPHEK